MALRDKMLKNAQPYLQPGEQVQAVFGAQTSNQWWILLFGVWFLIKNRYRVVVATDRRIVILAGGVWTTTKVSGVAGELPRATVMGPPSGLWWKSERLGGLYVHKRFHKDVTQADRYVVPQ